MIKVTEYKATSKLAITSSPLGSEFMLLANQFPSHSKWVGRELVVRPTGENIDHIVASWPQAEWDEAASAIRDAYVAKKEQAASIAAEKQKLLVDPDYPYKTMPYRHQEQAFVLQRNEKAFALLMDMGTGKTKVVLDTAAYLYSKGEIDCLLVISWPSGIHQVWVEDEAPIHCSVPWVGLVWDGKKTKRKQAEIDAVLVATDALKIISFNMEAVARSEHALATIKRFFKHHKVMMVIDESIAIKNPTAKSTQVVTSLGKDNAVTYRRILTGAQVTNSSADVFAQYRFLDQDIIGLDTYTSFKAKYCIMQCAKDDHRREFIVGYQNLPELVAKITPYSYRVRKEECLDLPPKIYKRLPFDLSPKEQGVYKSLQAEYMATLDDKDLTAELALVRLARLQQISCGWFPDDDGGMMMINDAKPSRLAALQALLAECPDSKVIIFSRFVADVVLITRTLGPQAVSYYGQTSGDQRREARHKFQNDPSCRFFVAQYLSASRGLTLTAADVVIYYSHQYSLDLRLQSEDRAHRIDEERMKGRSCITYYDLCANGTADAKIAKALVAKKDVADAINVDPKSGFLDYA